MANKEDIITRQLANEFLRNNEGDQIETMPMLAKKYSVGFGTIDKALNNLKTKGVIELHARGQMGTFLVKKDFLKLFELAGNGPFVGQLPLPNAIEFEGLATGFTEVFSNAGVPFALNFKNGASARLESLLNKRCDFIIVSESSAERIIANEETEIVAKLSPKTFYSNLYVIYRKDAEKRDEWKIGVDHKSYDNMLFSEREFPSNQKINIPYYNFPYAIADGRIDAAVIHSRTFVAIDLINKLEFEPLIHKEVIGEVSRATIVTLKENIPACELFKNIIDVKKIEQIGKMVVDCKMVPSF